MTFYELDNDEVVVAALRYDSDRQSLRQFFSVVRALRTINKGCAIKLSDGMASSGEFNEWLIQIQLVALRT